MAEPNVPRYVQQKDGYRFSDLSVAVDEIYALRAMLADEASIIEAHLGYKTFPKTRRAFAEAQVERMRQAARGDYEGAARRENGDPKRALKQAGADECLSNHQWAEQRGLVEVKEDSNG